MYIYKIRNGFQTGSFRTQIHIFRYDSNAKPVKQVLTCYKEYIEIVTPEIHDQYELPGNTLTFQITIGRWMSQLISMNVKTYLYECHNLSLWMSRLIFMNVITYLYECNNLSIWMSQLIIRNVITYQYECHNL